MLLVCDFCGVDQSTIFKMPNTRIETNTQDKIITFEQSTFEDYSNICIGCLIYKNPST